MKHNLRKGLLIALIVLGILLFIFVLISLLSVRTAKVSEINLVSINSEENYTDITFIYPFSYGFLVGSNYQIEDDIIRLNIKKAPFQGVFLGSSGQLTKRIKLEEGKQYRLYLCDDIAEKDLGAIELQ